MTNLKTNQKVTTPAGEAGVVMSTEGSWVAVFIPKTNERKKFRANQLAAELTMQEKIAARFEAEMEKEMAQ